MTNEYQLNVSANKIRDWLVRGYMYRVPMCRHWYMVEHRGWNDSFEIWVWWFWQENRLSVLLVLLPSSLARISSKHFWRLPTEKQKTKRNGDVLVAERVVSWLLKVWCFLWVLHCAKKMFLSFVTSHLTVSPHFGLLSKEEGWSFVAVHYRQCSLVIKNCVWILGTSDAQVSLLCLLHIYLHASKWVFFSCQNWKPDGFGCVRACGFDVSFSLRWKNRHIQYISTQIYTYSIYSSVYPPRDFSCA